MFLDLDKKKRDHIAAVDDASVEISYGELCGAASQFAQVVPSRSFIFILSTNSIGSLLGYVGALSSGVVPLILSANTEETLYRNLYDLYLPEYVWAPVGFGQKLNLESSFRLFDYELLRTGHQRIAMHPDLALLLPTSGSTGSPKLVRHSLRNVESNAYNVCRLFELTPEEKAMAVLPMHYTMGLSVITSHLYAGATLLLSGKSLLDRGFWNMFREATSFTGVPYSYDLLMKLRFTRMDLPNLRTISQGGGKLTPEMFEALARYASDTGRRFIATYGQSECTARMAYLPAHMALNKICSIGIAEPGGVLSIIDDTGTESFDGPARGEMIFRGENVTLGYAQNREDLLKGDENHGIMHTGDLARRDADGCYFIEGRLKRFLKIFGLRIGLDEVEEMIRSEFGADCYCKGTDDCLVVLVTDANLTLRLPSFIEEKTHLFHKNIEVRLVDAIVRNEAGKVINQ